MKWSVPEKEWNGDAFHKKTFTFRSIPSVPTVPSVPFHSFSGTDHFILAKTTHKFLLHKTKIKINKIKEKIYRYLSKNLVIYSDSSDIY
ncbi:hypothetical protein BpHYR1_045238 [Brachionus plicatilis]|uniref:Uncharacterized protein n=1 Tax=Brachionus plicatilis TaxID=10195 RepID=A0A3M7SG30_BRAPC|nr:hypothetical protein BpHYR1_045238 [Brachionus plicatilis]